MNNKTILYSILIIILAVVTFFAFRNTPDVEKSLITNFTECSDAGYPVMESFPRQCRTPEGELFIEEISNPSNPPIGPVAEGEGECFVGGCSGQICSDERDVVSTCEYREEYACYKTALCERQAGGECGWTETPALSTCLASNIDFEINK